MLTNTADKEVNNSRDAGVDKVNFTQYREQVGVIRIMIMIITMIMIIIIMIIIIIIY